MESDEKVVLNCEHFGRPTPIVNWFKDNKRLNLTEEKYRLEAGGSLRIVRIHAVDSGNYQCVVANRIDKISRSFNVQVAADTRTINKLTTVQIVLIIIVSIASFVMFILLLIALAYAFQQRQEHTNLVKKHKKLIRFLNDGNEADEDLDEEQLINTKLENLERLKFDDQKWEILWENFIIHHDKVLGQGNFGKVCLATVSNKLIRNETDLAKDMTEDLSLSDNLTPASTNTASRFMRRLSMKKSSNPYVAGGGDRKGGAESDMNNVSEPLLTKDERRIKAAAKMVKG